MKILHNGKTYRVHFDKVEVKITLRDSWGFDIEAWKKLPRNGKTAVAVRKIAKEFLELQKTEE